MPTWRLHLTAPWQRFARPAADLVFLGTAQREAQIGALGLRPDGSFVLVNGDHASPVGTHQILRALRSTPGGQAVIKRHQALRAGTPEPAPAPPAAAAPRPQIVIKKRRRLPMT